MRNFIKKNNQIRSMSGITNQIGKNNNNVLYGKLGMSPVSYFDEIYYNKDENTNESDVITEVNSIKILSKCSYKPHSNVSISSAITSKARVKLYNAFMDLTSHGARLLYCDTDSIVIAVNKNNIKKFLNNPIGQVFFDTSKPDTEILDSIFALPKTYSLKLKTGEEITKMKGFKEKVPFNKFK